MTKHGRHSVFYAYVNGRKKISLLITATLPFLIVKRESAAAALKWAVNSLQKKFTSKQEKYQNFEDGILNLTRPEIAYIAGLIDGEGSIVTYSSIRVEISTTSERLRDWLREVGFTIYTKPLVEEIVE